MRASAQCHLLYKREKEKRVYSRGDRTESGRAQEFSAEKPRCWEILTGSHYCVYSRGFYRQRGGKSLKASGRGRFIVCQ
jgi:hypothetical protein